MPLVSIIVPVLDEAAGIQSALARLAPLRQHGAELLVVDGGSTDETLAKARAWCDQLISAPRGRGSQMNAGADRASGVVLLFLHADTVLPEGALDAIVSAIDRGARWGRFDVAIDGASRCLPLIAWLMNRRSRWTGIATGDQAIFVARSAFLESGGFPDISLMEDVAFCSLMRSRGRPACLRQKVVTSGRRWEKHGVAKTVAMMWCLRWRFFFGADPDKLAYEYGYQARQH